MTATLKKFMFETAFDKEPVPEPVAIAPEEVELEEEPEIIIPTFSEEEVAAARAEGFAAGKQEGQQETSVSVEARIADSLAAIESKCQSLFQSQKDDSQELSRGAITVAREVARKIIPTLAETAAVNEIEQVIQSVFEKIVEEPRVSLNVNPELADDLRDRIETMAKTRTYEGNIHVQPNESIAVGDCTMEWASGGTERDTAALWREIDKIIDRYLDNTSTVWDRPDEPSGEPTDEIDSEATEELPVDAPEMNVEKAIPAPEINPEADD